MDGSKFGGEREKVHRRREEKEERKEKCVLIQILNEKLSKKMFLNLGSLYIYLQLAN